MNRVLKIELGMATCLVLLLLLSSFKPVAVPIFLKKNSGWANVVDRSTELPKDVARKFQRDAARLALRLSAGGEDFRYLSPYLQKESIDLIFNALASVYLTDERGKSLERCNLHTFPSPSIDHLVIIYQKNVAWAQPLEQGLNETNSAALNDLLTKYKLVIEKHVNWTDTQDAITIRARSPLNMAAIGNMVSQIEGVDEIDLGIPKILGNDINAHRTPGAWEFDYVLRFGSWVSGRGKSHIWKFRVTDAGKVSFLGDSGEPVPDWMKCDGTSGRVLAGI